jgi:hypothetical protein
MLNKEYRKGKERTKVKKNECSKYMRKKAGKAGENKRKYKLIIQSIHRRGC